MRWLLACALEGSSTLGSISRLESNLLRCARIPIGRAIGSGSLLATTHLRQEAEVLFEAGPSRLVEAGGAEVLRCHCATQKIQQPWRPHGYIGKITARQSPWPGGRQRQRGHPPRGPDGRGSQEAEEAGPAPGSQPASQRRHNRGASQGQLQRQTSGNPEANQRQAQRQTSGKPPCVAV